MFARPGAVELQDIDVPEGGYDEQIVDIKAAGICGSDLHGIVSPGFRVPPLVLGHEFVGVCEGQPVAVDPLLSCGVCDLCARDLTSLCRDRRLVGVHRAGGLAQAVAVPRSSLCPLPQGLSWTDAAMIEPVANAVHALALTTDVAGSRLAIVGAGTVGLVCLLVATSLGARSVTMIEPVRSRRALATCLGAEMAGPDASDFDIVLDAAGSAQSRARSVAMLRPGGHAVWIGLADDEPGFAATDLVRGGKRITGSFAYTRAEFGQAIDLVRGYDFSWTTIRPLADAPATISALMRHETDIVKAIFIP
ncbi:MAG: alcohol dehydrogenase catalytic domain-containing protein [Acetobacteraceae bacterium]